jgi:protein TonB
MESSYTENSPGRWFVSGFLAIILILIGLVLLIREPGKSLPYLGPLMELEYVVVEQKTAAKPKEISKVQQKKEKTEPDPVEEKVQEQIIDVPKTPDILLETPNISRPDISVRSEKQKPAVVETSPSEVRRIDGTEELDNTDFEPIYNPKPDFPAVAQAAQINGYVDIDLLINEKGRVESYTIVKTHGHPLFAVETAKVLPRWRFPPPRIRGKKVRIKYLYRVRFTLN